MNAVSTQHREYVGNELFVTTDDFSTPDGWVLPREVLIHSVHCRNRGGYLGRSWYLQADGRTPEMTIDLIHFDGYDNDCLQQVEKFLKHNGYVIVDETIGLYKRS